MSRLCILEQQDGKSPLEGGQCTVPAIECCSGELGYKLSSPLESGAFLGQRTELPGSH